ncbi:UDP-glucose 4-epimerase GalE [Orrella daihaiensis]|uniref:UDP-glucose 4-epimerase n=1 Tax=Orrella daihaiensis TaxID=2782176 RepID=A0ABY4AQU3_9BURK|nr:UDP-glucose 4-epimerase GalE [Orrella daihaiensis]UOD51397.1 UDP-glucose 4-epimerase GalE [Orrella daihaiensis]
MKSVLVTGGAGYIGSHTTVQLLQAGFEVVVLDNLSNSHHKSLERVREITGRDLSFVQADVRDRSALRDVFTKHPISAVIHLAALKAVGESQTQPLRYYDNNVSGSLCLFEEMQRAGIYSLVISSSATVYGEQGTGQYDERATLAPTSVYGRTKRMVEDVLRDICATDSNWRVALLRYFNPVGAHPSGLIGEDPNGTPNNLMPFIAQVAVGKRAKLSVFGNDYPTPDGTGLRDYIHIQDLAAGHLAALDALAQSDLSMPLTVNLGTGQPYSVLQVVQAFATACGKPVPYEIVDRRPGDVAVCYADPALAHKLLGWQAKHGLDAMCADTWRWQQMNPDGYR